MTAIRREDDLVRRCIEGLKAVSDAIKLTFEPRRQAAPDPGFDGELTLDLPRKRGRQRFLVQLSRSHLSYALADGLLARLRKADLPWILFAPYVAPPLGRYLAERGVNYADALGNLHVTLESGRDLLAHVEGRSPPRRLGTSGTRVPGHLVTYAVLARPALLDQPVRAIALAAGVGKTAAADQLRRLTEQGFLVRTRSGPRLLRARELLDRWVAAYVDSVRPRWLYGRFRTAQKDPEQLAKALDGELRGAPWALGGGAAAWRMTRHYRGEETIVHVDAVPEGLPVRLGALPDEDGNLTVLTTRVPLAFEGVEPHLAQPLLVYTEMLASTDTRLRQAAEGVREQFLAKTP